MARGLVLSSLLVVAIPCLWGQSAVAQQTGCDLLAAGPVWPAVPAGPLVSFTELTSHATEAIAACREALAQQPDEPRFAYQLARSLIAVSREDPEARALLEAAAQSAYPPAQNLLAGIYSHGAGVAVDEARATELVRAAAGADYPPALANLGAIVGFVAATPGGFRESATWFQRAAELGDANAMVYLGFQLSTGLGLAIDAGAAKAWFEKGAALDNPNAIVALGDFHSMNLRESSAGEAEALWDRGASLGNRDIVFRRGLSSGPGHFEEILAAARQDHWMMRLEAGLLYVRGADWDNDAQLYVLVSSFAGFADWTPAMIAALKDPILRRQDCVGGDLVLDAPGRAVCVGGQPATVAEATPAADPGDGAPVTVDAVPGLRQYIQSNFVPDPFLPGPLGEVATVSVTVVELDEPPDGVPEIIFGFENGAMCGSAGCEWTVLRREPGGELVGIGSIIAAGVSVGDAAAAGTRTVTARTRNGDVALSIAGKTSGASAPGAPGSGAQPVETPAVSRGPAYVGPCRSGARWVGSAGSAAYDECGDNAGGRIFVGRTLVRLSCAGAGPIEALLENHIIAGTSPGEPIAVAVSVDGVGHEAAGIAGADEFGGEAIPQFRIERGSPLLGSLREGRRAVIKVANVEVAVHLSGSSKAFDTMLNGCRGR